MTRVYIEIDVRGESATRDYIRARPRRLLPPTTMLRHACRSRALRSTKRGLKTISSLSNVLATGAPVDVHPEVRVALATGQPVVALETTIVTHGMPQPTNLETARAVESIVRSQGAIPATMGVIGGRIKIGLHPNELEYLADIKSNPNVVKVSRRDLGPAIALKRDGGTTCSTTLMFAAMAGIKVRSPYASCRVMLTVYGMFRSSQQEGKKIAILRQIS